jgi:hypothetical protein
VRSTWLFLVAACGVTVGDEPEQPGVPTSAPDDPGAPGSAVISMTRYLEEYARIHCEQAFACRAAFPPDLGYSFEDAHGRSARECSEALVAYWDPDLLETEIAKGRIRYDGAAAATCLDGVTYGPCDDFWRYGVVWGAACYHVIVGNVAEGDACTTSYACTTGYCDSASLRCR